MGLTSLILVGCQVLLVVVQSAPTGPTSFQITETLVIKYDSEAARDQYLPQLESNYRNALNEFQASNVKLTFISATDVPGSASIHLVQFRVTGQVVLPITDFAKVKTAVRQVLRDSHFSGIVDSEWDQYETVSVTDASDTSDTSASGGSSTSATSGAGDASQQFETTDSISITYTSTTERDNILQQFVAFWTTALSSFQVTTVKITFVSEGAASSSSSSYKLVTYKVTASYSGSNKPDADTVKTTVHQAIQTAKLTGVEEQQAAFGAASGAAAAGSASAGDASAGGSASGTDQSFETTDTLSIIYTSTTERDNLLQQFVAYWTTALASYQVTNVKIIFVSEAPTSGSYKLVTYKVTATYKGSAQIDGDKIKTTVHQAIQTAKLAGVQEQQAAFGSAQGVDDNKVDGSVTGADARSDTAPGDDHTIETTDAAIITYSSSAELSKLLQLILAKWQEAFSQFHIAFKLKVSIVSQQVSGGAHRVVYKVTASSPSSIHTAAGKSVAEIVKTVKQTITTSIAGIPSVKPLTPEERQKFDASAENLDNKFNKPALDAAAPAGGDASGTPAPTGDQPGTPAPTGDASAAGGDHLIQTTDAAIITYSSTAERDKILDDILAQWRAAFSQFKITTITISFVSEQPSGSGHRVVYRVNVESPDSFHGVAGKPVSEIVKTAKQTVHTTIIKVTGVQALTAADQATFDASSENIDNQFNKPGSNVPAPAGGTPAPDVPAPTPASGSDSTPAPAGGYAVIEGGKDNLETTDVAILSYTSPAERQQLLDQILAQWKAALSQFKITEIRISFISEKTVDGGKRVVYKIFAHNDGSFRATAGKPVADIVKSVKQTVRQTIITITGVKILSATEQQTFDGSDENLDNKFPAQPDTPADGGPSVGTVTATGGRDPVPSAGGDDHRIETTDVALITYSSPDQLKTILNLILAKWKDAFSQFHIPFSLAISITSQQVSGGAHRVVYKVTATSPSSIHTAAGQSVAEIVRTVKQTITASIGSIPSVQPLAPEEKKKFDTSSENIDNQFNKPGSDAPAPASGDASATPAADAPTTGDQTVTPAPNGDAPVAGGDHLIQTTDAAVITYSTTEERDRILNNILEQWRAAFSQFKIKTITISFVSEQPSGTGHRVVYRVNVESSDSFHGVAGKPVTEIVKTAKQTVHTTIIKVTGVQALTAAEQVTFDASSENIDNQFNKPGPDAPAPAGGTPAPDVSTPGTGSDSTPTLTAVGVSVSGSASAGGDGPQPTEVQGNLLPSLDGGNGGSFAPSDEEKGRSLEDVSKMTDGGRLEVTDVSQLTYTTTAERDALLQSILQIWINVLGSANKGGLTITFVSEQVFNGAHIVTYKISGTTGRLSISADQLLINVHKSIDSGAVVGVKQPSSSTIISGGGSGSKTITWSKQQISSGGLSSNIMNYMRDNSLTVQGVAEFSYTTTVERDAILQKILAVWIEALGSANVGGLKISFVSEVASPISGGYIVTYSVTGKIGKLTITIQQLLQLVNKLIGASKVPGVKLPSGSGSFSSSSSSQWTVGGRGSVPSSQTGGNQLDVTDAAEFSYTTNAERDAYLQKILNLWISVIGSSNIKIVFVSETPSGNGGRQVTYRITGTTGKQTMPQDQLVEKIHKSITTVTGVKIVPNFNVIIHWTVIGRGNGGFQPVVTPAPGSALPPADTPALDAPAPDATPTPDAPAPPIAPAPGTPAPDVPVPDVPSPPIAPAPGTPAPGTPAPDVPVPDVPTPPIASAPRTPAPDIPVPDVPSPPIAPGPGTPGPDVSVPTVPVPSGRSDGGGSGQVIISSGYVSGKIEVTDVSELTYTNTVERDRLLQLILNLWIKALGSATNGGLKIAFVKEQPVGRGSFYVTYTITGQLTGKLSITWQQLLEQVELSITAAKIDGVKVPSGSVTVDHWRGSYSKQISIGGQLTLTDNLQLTYKNTVERDALLQKILLLWIEALGSANTGGLKIEFISEKPSPSGDGSFIVSYRITGTTGKLNVQNPQDLVAIVHKFIESGRIVGVRIVVTVFTGTITGGGSLVPKIKGSGSLTIKDVADLVYKTTVERDFLLQLILNLWTQTLGSANIGGLKVVLISEEVSCNGGHYVTYQITGKVGKLDITPTQLLEKIHVLIAANKVAGVFVKGKRCYGGDILITHDIEDIYGTVELTYTTVEQRDALLQLILKLWIDAYGCSDTSGLQINFIKEAPTGRGTYLVTYTITGSACETTISWQDMLLVVTGYLEEGKVPGAKPPPSNNKIEPPPEVTGVPSIATRPPYIPTRPSGRRATVFDRR
ncbi:hypothetical protein BV898_14513 [Hypsibius exemplaris]|uniref:SEA domain-containing protein n=1 Tax=Hypsibius exemplaris TaxID=2072580 RepID=A0A9X6NC26_HYPEX|nr:hypothetical protein BV898_14513 [Hypsibius exemplaris]